MNLNLHFTFFLKNRSHSAPVFHATTSGLAGFAYIPHHVPWPQLTARKEALVRPQCSVCLKTFSRRGSLAVRWETWEMSFSGPVQTRFPGSRARAPVWTKLFITGAQAKTWAPCLGTGTCLNRLSIVPGVLTFSLKFLKHQIQIYRWFLDSQELSIPSRLCLSIFSTEHLADDVVQFKMSKNSCRYIWPF